jgi:hypothetical protein
MTVLRCLWLRVHDTRGRKDVYAYLSELLQLSPSLHRLVLVLTLPSCSVQTVCARTSLPPTHERPNLTRFSHRALLLAFLDDAYRCSFRWTSL